MKYLSFYISTLPTMSLCSICDQLDLRDLTDSNNDLQDILHHKSLASLKLSALACALCKLFFDGLSLNAPSSLRDEPDLEYSPIVLRGYQHVDNEGNQGGIWQLKVRCDKARARALFGLYPDEGLECHPVSTMTYHY